MRVVLLSETVGGAKSHKIPVSTKCCLQVTETVFKSYFHEPEPAGPSIVLIVKPTEAI